MPTFSGKRAFSKNKMNTLFKKLMYFLLKILGIYKVLYKLQINHIKYINPLKFWNTNDILIIIIVTIIGDISVNNTARLYGWKILNGEFETVFSISSLYPLESELLVISERTLLII